MDLFNELTVWILLAFIVILLTIIVLLKGILWRFNEPNKELKERVHNLERQVNELDNKK